MGQSAFSYRVGDYRILLESTIRSEVLAQDMIYPVPYAPDWCVGLASVRGDLSPVIDMHKVLLKNRRPAKQYLLWLQHESFAPVVLSCDELPRQIAIPEANSQSGRLPGLPGWITDVWTQEKGLLMAADHRRLFKMISQSRSTVASSNLVRTNHVQQ